MDFFKEISKSFDFNIFKIKFVGVFASIHRTSLNIFMYFQFKFNSLSFNMYF